VLLNASTWLEQTNIKLQKRENLSESLSLIETSWKELNPEGIFNAAFLDDILARNYALEQFVFRGFTTFSVLTIVIGCLGLYGLLSYITIRKSKEVGIRKVLGATVTQIVGLFSREFIVLVMVAFLIAAPLAYYFMNQWLQDFVYHIELSWWMFILGALATIVIAIVTIGYQSIKSALANPVESLRTE
jgi:ABC-type antimicrobial peptide transport system permease subunit